MAAYLVLWLSLELLYQDIIGLDTMATVTKYTIHNTPQTWNEARDICNAHGSRLLTMNNVTEWALWQYLMNPNTTANPRPASVYWAGIHAPDPDDPETFYWDTCDDLELTIPLFSDIVPGYWHCVYIWFYRKVFNYQFFSMWVKGKPCNDMLPFICEATSINASCIPACDEVLYAVTEQTCSNACAGNQSCISKFNQMLNICHLVLGRINSKKYLTICRLPFQDLGYTRCNNTTDESTDIIVLDQNINVTDKVCLEQNTESTTSSEETSNALSETTKSNTNGIENTAITGHICLCSCDALRTFLTEPLPGKVNLTMEEKIDIIVRELTIDKKNTSSSQRKHISVMDYRPSSVCLGSVGAGIIVAIVAVIVVIDISRIWKSTVKLLDKAVGDVRNNKVHAKTINNGGGKS